MAQRTGLRILTPTGTGNSLSCMASSVGADVVHVDRYGGGEDLRYEVHGANAILSSMEDGSFGRREADVAIDSNLGAQSRLRPGGQNTILLRGLRYAPIRNAVRLSRLRPRDYRTISNDARVLVVMGGTDPFRRSAQVVGLCASTPGIEECTVIAGEDQRSHISSVAEGFSFNLIAPVENLAEFSSHFDLVISAAGTTVWELACVGAPMALVQVADNQASGYRGAVEVGIAVGLGLGEDLATRRFAVRTLEALLIDRDKRAAMGTIGRGLVDGAGGDRIVKVWESLLADGAVVVARPADLSDAELLFEWRNDPASRSASRSSLEIDRESHIEWLKRALADPSRLLLVITENGAGIGTVRFDCIGNHRWEVSINLAPGARGRGMAGRALSVAELEWTKSTRLAETLLAFVREHNINSRKLFEKAGYRRDTSLEHGGMCAFVKHIGVTD